MSKLKLVMESVYPTNMSSEYQDVQEVVIPNNKPDYSIIDITVLPDELYQPTIQAILISLDEDACLKESDSKLLDINILSETVNNKTGYSHTLFEFESSNSTITLSLVLQECERKGVYKVQAYTTKGIKVFECNTLRPKETIKNYLNSLAQEYLISKPIKEADDIKDILTSDVKEDLAIEPGSDEEAQLEELYDLSQEDDEDDEDELIAQKLSDEIITNALKIDYSNWNSLSPEEKEERVRPKLTEFFNKHEELLKNNVLVFIYFLVDIEDASLNTESKVLYELYNKSRKVS